MYALSYFVPTRISTSHSWEGGGVWNDRVTNHNYVPPAPRSKVVEEHAGVYEHLVAVFPRTILNLHLSNII